MNNFDLPQSTEYTENKQQTINKNQIDHMIVSPNQEPKENPPISREFRLDSFNDLNEEVIF